MFRPATRFGRRQEPNRTTLEPRGSGPANTPRGIVRVPSPCLRPLTPFVTHPAARRSFPILRSSFAPRSFPTRPRPPRWSRSCRSIPVRSSDVSSRTRSARPGFPGSASRAGSIEPSHLGPSERSACHTPMGGTSHSERLAPCRSTSKLVSARVGRNRTRLVQHHRSRAMPSHRPVLEVVRFLLVRSHSQLGSAWEPSRARSNGAPDRRLQPTVSVSQRRPLTPRLTPSLVSPLGPGIPASTLGDPLRRVLPQCRCLFDVESIRLCALRGTVPLPFRRRPRDRTRLRADTRDRSRPFQSGVRVDVARPSRSERASTHHRDPSPFRLPLSRFRAARSPRELCRSISRATTRRRSQASAVQRRLASNSAVFRPPRPPGHRRNRSLGPTDHPSEPRTSPSLDGDGRVWIAEAYPEARSFGRTTVLASSGTAGFSGQRDRSTGLHPEHPSSLRVLFNRSGSAVASYA